MRLSVKRGNSSAIFIICKIRVEKAPVEFSIKKNCNKKIKKGKTIIKKLPGKT